MQEKDFQTKFSTWWKYNKIYESFELKITKKSSLPFSRLEPHQLHWLKFGGGYKIPDVGFDQKPCDFITGKPGGYVAVQFYKRGVKHFYIIHIDAWEKCEKTCGRKSLTEDMAKEIAWKVGVFKK